VCFSVAILWEIFGLRLYQCYVSCVPDMEVTKVPQNRAQLELIAQGGGGAAAEEREIRFQALLLVRRLTLLQVGVVGRGEKNHPSLECAVLLSYEFIPANS
jgi:hypothetical protein